MTLEYDNINFTLMNSLDESVLSPVFGIMKIRKVLGEHNIDLPALYDLDPDGDEVIISISDSGKIYEDFDIPDENAHYLYLIYQIEEDGQYNFHAEITDRDGVEHILRENDDLDDDV